jgi:hypothetical protein
MNDLPSQNVNRAEEDEQNVFSWFPTPVLEISEKVCDRTFIEKSPYKKSKSFTVEDWQVFFGRDRLSLQLLQDLDKQDLILLLGAAESGKTSLVEAGLISRLKQNLGGDLTVVRFQPENNPFLSLFNALIEAGCDREVAQKMLLEDSSSLTVLAQTLQAKSDRYWLFFLDNLEELFESDERAKINRFLDNLTTLCDYLV